MKRVNLTGVCCLLVAVSLSQVNAGIIDFESTSAGGVPVDNSEIRIDDIFSVGGVSVRFGFDSNDDGTLDSNAVFEQSGNTNEKSDTGFWGIGGVKDVPATGYQSLLGNFFLRQSKPYKPFGVFTILYDSISPVTATSGEIWDIDGTKKKTEQFLVQAFNGDLLLSSIESPLGNNAKLDAKPWTFGFDGLSDISKVEITFIGSKTRGIGLAFNNFSPIEDVSDSSQYEPEPESIILFIAGVFGMASSVFDKRFFKSLRRVVVRRRERTLI